MLRFCTRVCMGVFGMFCCYVRKKALLQCPLQLLRGGIWACMRCPCLCLCLGFGIGDYVSQLPCVRYYVFVKEQF